MISKVIVVIGDFKCLYPSTDLKKYITVKATWKQRQITDPANDGITACENFKFKSLLEMWTCLRLIIYNSIKKKSALYDNLHNINTLHDCGLMNVPVEV